MYTSYIIAHTIQPHTLLTKHLLYKEYVVFEVYVGNCVPVHLIFCALAKAVFEVYLQSCISIITYMLHASCSVSVPLCLRHCTYPTLIS